MSNFFKKNFKLPKFDNIENYAKKIITSIDEQAKNIVNEITNEENKNKKGQSLEEQYPYPWSDEIDEETVKNAIVALSLDNRNFLISPVDEDNFTFDLNENLHYAVNLLKFDKRLENLRYNIVPKQIKEDIFWKNYFYRISLIKSGQDIKTLPDIFLPEEIPKAEEPENLKKNATEEIFNTDVFDKEEEEELLKDFEKEIGDAIRLEEINTAKNKTITNTENIKKDENNINEDIDSLENFGSESVESKLEIDVEPTKPLPSNENITNISNTSEHAAIDSNKNEFESEDDLSIGNFFLFYLNYLIFYLI